MSAEPAHGSWMRRHSSFVASTVVAAALAGSVSLGYWYFAQRPIQKQDERQIAERAAVRNLYEDTRRTIEGVRARFLVGRDEGGPIKHLAYGKKVLRHAIIVHNRAYRLMRDEEYDEATIAFRKAQEMLMNCEPCRGLLP